MNDDNDDNLPDDEELEEIPFYEVDEQTRQIIEAALNCLLHFSDAQIDEDSALGLQVIAEDLALRFGIDRIELEETQHEDEIIYKPKGGFFNDDEDEDQTP
tara:strand:- start:740 stop:1042 length:303 start_codon:yes stop_codon:yes gene_type:complete